MDASVTKFERDINAWIQKTKIGPSLVLRKLALDLYTGVVTRSPVDSGRFRASHRIGINHVDDTVAPEGDHDTGAVAGDAATGDEIRGALLTLKSAKFGDTINVSNSLVYGPPLEAGSSAQTDHAPDGIYGASYHEMVANLDAALRRFKT